MAIVAAAQYDLKNQMKWHKNILAGAKTSAELQAIYKADMQSLTEALSTKNTACETVSSTECQEATAWTLIH